MYPNEIALYWSVLIVLYPVHHGTGGGRIHSGVAGARLPGGSGQPTYRLALLTALAFLLVAPLPLLLHLGHPERSLGDVLYPASTPRPWRCSASSTSGT